MKELKSRIKIWRRGILLMFLKHDNLEHSDASLNVYEELAPKDDLDNNEYIEALEWALKNKKIFNIAITGPYGSGKSSILRTFEKANQQNYKFLNISLASFSLKEEKDDQETNLNRLIERSILQQIFYREKPSDIPQSRFKRIFSISKSKIISYSFILVLWLFSLLNLFYDDFFSNLNLWNDFSYSGHYVTESLMSIIFLFGLLWLIYKFINVLNQFSFSRLNFIKGEIEIAKDVDASILNKHLDEILYFFEEQEYDVVVIEDIDRFNNVDIFTKLRELNILLNQSNQVNRHIRFIYAIRDELFKNIEGKRNNRTKFFDFIIPIIPVVNSSNSNEILSRKLVKEIKDERISKRFLSDVALYVEDMRLLKNICNEFFIYREQLNSESLDQEKIFSIVLYKNLYPEDFSLLQLNKGKLANVFTSKKELQNQLTSKIKESIKDKESQIGIIEDENISSCEELRKLYILEIYKMGVAHNQGVNYARINNQNVPLESLIEEKEFDDFRSQNNSSILNRSSNMVFRINSFAEIENRVSNDFDYDKRANIINGKNNGKIQKLKREINILENKISRLNTLTIKDLFKEFSVSEIIKEEVGEDNVKVFLLRNGYIDEMYSYYVSNFYEGALKRSDFDFVLGVKSYSKLEFDYSLENIDELINRLYDWEFSLVEVLNNDLVNYLLENETKYGKQLKIFFSQFSVDNKTSIEFLKQFVKVESHDRKNFIKYLSKYWISFWGFLEAESNFDEVEIESFSYWILSYAELDDIVEINKQSDGRFVQFLNERQSFISFFHEKNIGSKIEEVLKKLDLKFSKLELGGTNSSLFRFIYDHNLYELNIHMIRLMLKEFCFPGRTNFKTLETKPYTFLKGSKCKQLNNYVGKEINRFIQECVLKVSSLKETQSYFVELLNDRSINFEIKQNLILKQELSVTSISKIKDKELWNSLIKNKKVNLIWTNLLNYYQIEEEIDESLVHFMNDEKVSVKIGSKKIPNSFPDKLKYSFLNKLSSTNKIKIDNRIRFLVNQLSTLSREEIGELLNKLPYPYFNLNRSLNRPILRKSEHNLKLITELKSKSFISSFSEEENEYRVNVKSRVPGE